MSYPSKGLMKTLVDLSMEISPEPETRTPPFL